MTTETNNLDTFRILFIVKGILTLLFSLFFFAYASFGYFFTSSIPTEAAEEMPFNVGIIFTIIGGIGIVISLVFGSLTLFAAKYLKERKNYTFILVIAIINCITGVLGLLLGIFTIIELNKPEVKLLFDKNKQTP